MGVAAGLSTKSNKIGALNDNKGKIALDKTYDNLDPIFGSTDYLLEGVVGSIT